MCYKSTADVPKLQLQSNLLSLILDSFEGNVILFSSRFASVVNNDTCRSSVLLVWSTRSISNDFSTTSKTTSLKTQKLVMSSLFLGIIA